MARVVAAVPVILALLAGLVLCEDVTFRGKVIVYGADYYFDLRNTSLFEADVLHGALCNVQSTSCVVHPVSCSDFTELPVEFSSETCFSAAFEETFGFLDLYVNCVAGDSTQTFTLEIIHPQIPPVCISKTVNVLVGDDEGAQFFFDIVDTNQIYYAITVPDDQLMKLQGDLLICLNCTISEDNPEFKSLKQIAEADRNYAQQLLYKPPLWATRSWTETISFVATQAGAACNPHGVVSFTMVLSTTPLVTPPTGTATLTEDTPQLIRVDGTTTANQLAFILSKVPDPTCALICPLLKSVTTQLALKPGEPPRSDLLGCDEAASLHANANVTLFSGRGTFFKTTFIAVNPLRSCASSFEIVATDGINYSAPVSYPFRASASRVRCHHASVASSRVPLTHVATWDSRFTAKIIVRGWFNTPQDAFPLSQDAGFLTVESSKKVLQTSNSTAVTLGDYLQLRRNAASSFTTVTAKLLIEVDDDPFFCDVTFQWNHEQSSSSTSSTFLSVALYVIVAVIVVLIAVKLWQMHRASALRRVREFSTAAVDVVRRKRGARRVSFDEAEDDEDAKMNQPAPAAQSE